MRYGKKCTMPDTQIRDREPHFLRIEFVMHVNIMKEVIRMYPVIFTIVDNFPMNQVGSYNIKNVNEKFGCTIISCKPNIKAQKILIHTFFEKYKIVNLLAY